MKNKISKEKKIVNKKSIEKTKNADKIYQEQTNKLLEKLKQIEQQIIEKLEEGFKSLEEDRKKWK